MFKRRLGLLTIVLLTMMRVGIADADGPTPDASGPAPMSLAQTDDTPSPLTLVCCFGGTSSSQCTQSSPNQPGCEFVMAYNCGKAGYSCDTGKGVCSCNTTAADSGLSQPSQ